MTGSRRVGDGEMGLEERFFATISDMVPQGSRLLLAVSGGSDSIGMMCLAAGVRDESGLSLEVGFVDHQLRSGVDAEWDLVSRIATEAGLAAHRLRVESPADGPAEASLQQWAREARYGLLIDLAHKAGCGYLATAHTMDDQAETLLMRMLRGAGIDGLAGVPRHREADGVVIVRPLLGFTRHELRHWLSEQSVAWVEDPSNDDPRFERTRVRAELVPLLERWHPGIRGRLAALADECGDLASFADGVLEQGSHIRQLRLGRGFAVDLGLVPPGVRTRMVRALLRRVRGDLRRIDRVHVDTLAELARRGASSDAVPMPGGAVAYSHGTKLLVFPSALPARPSGAGQPSASGSGTWRLRFAALGALVDVVSGIGEVSDLELRARHPGDRLFRSERKLKDLLIEARVPRPYRDFVPVLAAGEGILACPGILPCRHPGMDVRWLLDENAPFLDVDFPMKTS